MNLYIEDLERLVAIKLVANNINDLAVLSVRWGKVIDKRVWISGFIDVFGSRLPKGVNYEEMFLSMRDLSAGHLIAIRRGYVDVLKSLIELKNSDNLWLSSLLSYASKYPNTEITKLLTPKEKLTLIEINNLMFWAMDNGNLDLFQIVGHIGGFIHVNNDSRLIITSKTSSLEIIELLISRNSFPTPKYSKTYHIHRIVSDNGSVPMLELLMASEININLQLDNLIEDAIEKQDLPLIAFLVGKGATIPTKQ